MMGKKCLTSLKIKEIKMKLTWQRKSLKKINRKPTEW